MKLNYYDLLLFFSYKGEKKFASQKQEANLTINMIISITLINLAIFFFSLGNSKNKKARLLSFGLLQ